MSSVEQLRAVLLDPKYHDAAVNAACAALYNRLVRTGPATADAVHGATPSWRLAAGLALSPDLAAQCLLDGPRTAAFLRGSLDQALRVLRLAGRNDLAPRFQALWPAN